MDPAQSYYKGIQYRAGTDFQNISRAESSRVRDVDAACLDSSQAWFCRDLWVRSAREAMEEMDLEHGNDNKKREVVEVAARDPLMHEARQAVDEDVGRRQAQAQDPDANVGSDYDAISDEEAGEIAPLPEPEDSARLSIPNSLFRPARILVNPRCPTTYAGVSHTQLARDLFGDGDSNDESKAGKYVLEDWEGAPESFVCQEQRSVSCSCIDERCADQWG